MLTPAAYLLATIHGLMMGTDSKLLYFQSMYVSSVCLTSVLLIVRFASRKGCHAKVVQEAEIR
ncbi:hypothetical protein skT53_10160 [Effusibacillus dendaii]|uniref:Uncharacterized protein n=2 Tax=Effusibacillus dendaii TaxID=2743772 RepID=A0A7I8DDR4_9BACL|nr:hypothetical protein skT53_10160 [Effusibacillus dendaii]